MGNLPLNQSNNVIVNCAAAKKKNIETSSEYYSSMESYISSKNSAYSTFSNAMNQITATTFDGGETPTTRALEAAVYTAKSTYDNIPTPPSPLTLNTNCCTTDNMLYHLGGQSCITPTILGSYQMSDNVYSNKLSYSNSSIPDIGSCTLACSTDYKACFQALYNKSTKICYLMGKDDPTKSYTYTYSRDYSLLTAPPPPNSPPTNIPIPPSSPSQPIASEFEDIIQDETLQAVPPSDSSSIIIIVAVSITMLFVLFMIYMFFLRKTS
jgi:hypothetical protein